MEKRNIDFPLFNRDIPVGTCTRCNVMLPLTQLHQLPEVEIYARKLALFMSGKGESPATIKDDTLIQRYGYGFKSLFCASCHSDLVAVGPNS